MKIQSSAVQMNATHSLSQKSVVQTTVVQSFKTATVPSFNGNPIASTFYSPYDQYDMLGNSGSKRLFSVTPGDSLSNERFTASLQKKLLSHIIQVMRDMMQGTNFTSFHDSQDLLTSPVEDSQTLTYSTWYYRETVTTDYSESESTTFDTNGLVKTTDGRNIPFSLSLSMSREFMQQTGIETVQEGAFVYKDPLVINMDVPTASVTDQEFYFDIDADGTEDAIHNLGVGSGFLALDKNNDGKINDGNELFGTQSGDGFSDLAAYDEDGNGWIDENDAIFSKLKVWTKDARGNDMLLSLKDADVGAIYLGNMETEFDLTGDENSKRAHIQSTGIYLHESTGLAGSVQHVDFAVKEKTSH